MTQESLPSPACACGCQGIPAPGKAFVRGHNRRKHPIPTASPCECGCDETANPGNRFVFGHGKRKPKLVPEPCACGCGEMTSGRPQRENRDEPTRYVSGHNAKIAHPMAGKHHTDEARAKLASYTGERASSYKHGWAGTPTHLSWRSMWSRCRDLSNASYPSYGGRGITVCERWREFENFLEDMGERPSLGYEIDRIDPDGNYEPSNCRWLTRAENNARRKDPGGWIKRTAKQAERRARLAQGLEDPE